MNPEFCGFLKKAVLVVKNAEGLTQAAVHTLIGAHVGATARTIRSYQTGDRTPSKDMVLALADFFLKEVSSVSQSLVKQLLVAAGFKEQADEILHALLLDSYECDEAISFRKKLYDLAKKQGDPFFAILGAIYVDLKVSDIKTQKLEPREHSYVGPANFDLGGSGMWVGRCRSRFFGFKSYVFGLRPAHIDKMTQALHELLQQETVESNSFEDIPWDPWIHDCLVSAKDPEKQTAYTIQFIQEKHNFKTLFTHRGVLKDLNWTSIQDELLAKIPHTAVLYLSGFLKTDLSAELSTHFSEFRKERPNVLVCLDFGRIEPEMLDPAPLDTMRTAIHKNWVDILFCTLQELWDYVYQSPDKKLYLPDNSNQTDKLLRELSLNQDLPFLTIVRDRRLPGIAKAYAIVNGQPFPFQLPKDAEHNKPIGSKNAFNAAFLHHLPAFVKTGEELKNRIGEAGSNALAKWYESPI